MKANLPEKNFFDSFYIWFNKDKKEEYYATPLYTYQNKTKINFTSRYYYTVLEFRTDSFTEFFFSTYASGRGDDYKKNGQLKYGRSDGTYLDVTNNIIIESPEDKKTGNRWTFKNRGYQCLTFSDNEPPTGTLLKFLQTIFVVNIF